MLDAGLRPEWRHYISETLGRLYALFGVTDAALRQFFEDVFDDVLRCLFSVQRARARRSTYQE